MQFKSTYVLLIVFAALGGYVYFAEYRGHDEREKQEAAKKKVFAIADKDITEISLVYPDRKITASRKDGKHWAITEPAGIDADADQWDMLASSLAGIEKQATVGTAVTDLAPYGLDHPVVQVAAKLADGHSVDIAFGGDNPGKTQSYAKRSDSSEVFMSAVSSGKAFQKTLTDLRNKKVLDFDLDNIGSIRLADGANEFDFQKSGMDWLLKKPLETKADPSQIAELLSTLQSAHATDFAGDEVNAAAAGLTTPSSKITLHDTKTNADKVLTIGKSPGTEKYYARDESRAAIFIINKEIPDKIRRPLLDWRDKSIAQLNRDAVDEIELVRGAVQGAVQGLDKLSLKKQGADWKLADGRKIQWDKVSGVLDALEFERAAQIIDMPAGAATYGIDKPRLEAVFRQSGKDLLALKFGSAAKNPDGVYLKVAANPAVFVVSADLFGKFNLKADDLVETPPAKK